MEWNELQPMGGKSDFYEYDEMGDDRLKQEFVELVGVNQETPSDDTRRRMEYVSELLLDREETDFGGRLTEYEKYDGMSYEELRNAFYDLYSNELSSPGDKSIKEERDYVDTLIVEKDDYRKQKTKDLNALRVSEIDGPVVTISEGRTRRVLRKAYHRDCEDIFRNVLDLEPQCYTPEFLDYLDGSGTLSIRRGIPSSGLLVTYTGKYLQGEFYAFDRELIRGSSDVIRSGIREHYDEWSKKELSKTMREAGVVAHGQKFATSEPTRLSAVSRI